MKLERERERMGRRIENRRNWWVFLRQKKIFKAKYILRIDIFGQ